jgi:hypothetical protein
LLFARLGADVVGLIQYLVGPDIRHDGLHGPVVVARPTEVIALAVRTSNVAAVEVGGSATDAVG